MTDKELTPLAEVVARLAAAEEYVTENHWPDHMNYGLHVPPPTLRAILSALRIATEYTKALQEHRRGGSWERWQRAEAALLATFAPASVGKEDHDD